MTDWERTMSAIGRTLPSDNLQPPINKVLIARLEYPERFTEERLEAFRRMEGDNGETQK